MVPSKEQCLRFGFNANSLETEIQGPIEVPQNEIVVDFRGLRKVKKKGHVRTSDFRTVYSVKGVSPSHGSGKILKSELSRAR